MFCLKFLVALNKLRSGEEDKVKPHLVLQKRLFFKKKKLKKTDGGIFVSMKL